MPLDIEDLPIVESAGRLGRRPSIDSPTVTAYQVPRLLAGSGRPAAGLAVGMQVAQFLQEKVFPAADQMAAFEGFAPPAYTTYGDCAGYNYDGTCNEACFGFAPHHMDPYYCATCTEQAADPNNNPSWNWHFVGSRGATQYKDREPDVCQGKDAWKWNVGACGNCRTSAYYRCHDGYKKYPNAAVWEPTICAGLISCDGRLTTC
ncbi:MAG: hypothetical protein ACRD0F_03495 [Acidimicrobiales bacterium]